MGILQELADVLRLARALAYKCAIAGVGFGGGKAADTIPALRARVVAGGANNRLQTPADGDALHARGILYAPDYVASAYAAADRLAEHRMSTMRALSAIRRLPAPGMARS